MVRSTRKASAFIENIVQGFEGSCKPGYISPQKNLIILRFGESYGDVHGADNWVKLFYNFTNQLEE